MGQESEHNDRIPIFQPFQVNKKLVDAAADDVIILHCLPAKRGEEITDEVIDAPYSVVLDEAENRLHAQKAVMAFGYVIIVSFRLENDISIDAVV